MEGDCNTSFFHKTASYNRKVNWISSIEGNGTEVSDFEGIKNAFTDYFKGIYV